MVTQEMAKKQADEEVIAALKQNMTALTTETEAKVCVMVSSVTYTARQWDSLTLLFPHPHLHPRSVLSINQ